MSTSGPGLTCLLALPISSMLCHQMHKLWDQAWLVVLMWFHHQHIHMFPRHPLLHTLMVPRRLPLQTLMFIRHPQLHILMPLRRHLQQIHIILKLLQQVWNLHHILR